MCGHDFKYKSITAYPSAPSKFKLQLKIWCCPKPCFSFHFSICATLSNIQLEKVSRKLIHSQNFPSTTSLLHLQATATSPGARVLLVACLENQKYFPGHCSSSLATLTWEFCCSVHSAHAALCHIALLSIAQLQNLPATPLARLLWPSPPSSLLPLSEEALLRPPGRRYPLCLFATLSVGLPGGSC